MRIKNSANDEQPAALSWKMAMLILFWLTGGILWLLVAGLAWGVLGLVSGALFSWMSYWSYNALIHASTSPKNTTRGQWQKLVLLRIVLSITLGLIFGYSLLEHIVSSETPVATYDDEPEPDDMVYNVIIVILVFTAKLLLDFILLIFLQWMRLKRARKINHN